MSRATTIRSVGLPRRPHLATVGTCEDEFVPTVVTAGCAVSSQARARHRGFERVRKYELEIETRITRGTFQFPVGITRRLCRKNRPREHRCRNRRSRCDRPGSGDDDHGAREARTRSSLVRPIVIGLGVTWILDGFEVTLVGALASVLTHPDTLHLSTQQASSLGTWYLLGAVGGALFFGYLTDRVGRKKLFMVTLGVYLVFTVASGLAWNFWSLAVFRVLAGAGIGGEYAAINSAIDELIPARVRGRVALAINGSWWFGTAMAAFLSYAFLSNIRESISWRLVFLLGAIRALGILSIRRFIPESPRWLLTHGRAEEAERVVAQIEEQVRKTHPSLPEPEGEPIAIEQRRNINFIDNSKYVITN